MSTTVDWRSDTVGGFHSSSWRRGPLPPAPLVPLPRPAAGASQGGAGTIRSVIDGDTAVLEDGRRIRYLGINAPERGEAYSAEATAVNRRLTEGRRVRLEPDQALGDRYHRLLFSVYVGGGVVKGRVGGE